MKNNAIKTIDVHNSYILIGGGDALNSSQKKYYVQAINLTKVANPRFLYLPFALLRTVPIKEITHYTDLLAKLLQSINIQISFEAVLKYLNHQELEEKVCEADIIYISGGNTANLIRYFKKIEFVSVLEKLQKKVIMANSAGVLALSTIGLSMYNNDLKMFKGIGVIKSVIPVVHYRKKSNNDIKLSSFGPFGQLLLLHENEASVLTENPCEVFRLVV